MDMATPPGGGGGGGGGGPGGGVGGGVGLLLQGEPQSVLTDIIWEDNSYQLKEFASKYPMPNVVRVTKGQYRNIGVAKSVASELYLHSIKTSKKVLAEGVKVKEGKRITTVEQKFSLPVTYQGWFELLSEDGKAIKPVQSVQELARVFPQRCLVRESVKVSLAARDSSGDVCLERTRLLVTGEQLSLAGDVTVPSPPGSKGPSRRKMLKAFDQQGETVYIGFEQKGMFSPIAGQGNISGVHNIKALLEKFRLPIMVRLVHGIIPSRLDKSSFTGVFRLLNMYSDETAFVCPMRRDAKMVPISTREPIKVTATHNFAELQEHEEVLYYHMRCGKMIASYHNSIHVLVNPPDPTRMAGRGWSDGEVFHRQGDGSPGQAQVGKGTPSGSGKKNGVTEEDILFDEIDDIYQFVRDGGRPPPPRPRPPHLRASDPNPIPTSVTNGTSSDQRPLSQGNPSANNLKFKRTGSKGELIKDQRSGVATAIISKTGAVDILNSSASASPEDTSPATTLSYQKQEKDENYWEEPIYEEISKYKKAMAARSKEQGKTASTTADPGVPTSSSPLRGEGLPVENLRQMYKLQTSMTAGSRMSFAGDTGDELSGEEEGRMSGPSIPLSGRFESPYQNTGFAASATNSPITPNSTPERRSSQGDSKSFGKRHESPALYHSGQPPPSSTTEEFKSVHDRIASINRVNTLSTGAIGGGGAASATVVGGVPLAPGGLYSSPDIVPGSTSGVRRYVRATTFHGNAGRGHGNPTPNPQFVAVARVSAGSTRSSGRGSQKGIQPQTSGSTSNSEQLSGRDRPERHSERSPRTAYSRVENLRRKLQGLYL